jgi:uncharacterized membrane protein
MNHWWFLFRLKQKQVLRAISESEALTSGEIRICISHKKSADPMTDAQAQFDKLNMANTRERNGILFFIAPRSRNFAIIGDAGIHAKCGDAFWLELSSLLTKTFKEGKLTEGLVEVVKRAGQLLAEHFPRRDDDRNELPDEIVRA